jgi:hypothetical protein
VGSHEAVSFYSKRFSWPTVYPSFSVTGALIMSLTYGFNLKSHDDPFLLAAERALHTLEAVAVPGAFLVDTFPIRTCHREHVSSPTEHDLQ